MSLDLLKLAFVSQEQIHLVGTANNLQELDALLTKVPHVALVGSKGTRKPSDALPFLERIAAVGLPVRPVVISEDLSQEDIVGFFYHGARGLLCQRESDLSVLTRCVLCVSAGQVWANSAQLEQLLVSLSQPRPLRVMNMTGDALLSQREEQVLRLLAQGLSNRDLARTLKLSEHTVKNHLFRIFDKLGVSNRMEAVLYAISKLPGRGGTPQQGVVAVMGKGAA